jgi:hypothetical protein
MKYESTLEHARAFAKYWYESYPENEKEEYERRIESLALAIEKHFITKYIATSPEHHNEIPII